ncbi:MAG: M20 family metallopeptidase [Bacillota bacterium]
MVLIEKFKNIVKKEELTDLISELVKIPSTPDSEGYERKVAEYIHQFFQDEGIESQLIKVKDNRPNIIAKIPGTGRGRSLMLTGHMDTVPAYDMDIDPFSGEIKNGRVYGRGAVDMKGPLACMMLTLVAVKRAKIELKGDLIFAGVIEEEYKSFGTEHLVKNGPKTDAAIVGEPSQLNIAAGHRGLEWLEITIEGKAAHGGTAKKGINAISKAAKFINKVEEELLPQFAERTHDLIGPPTLNFGVIKGGTQPSSVAGECKIQIDRRWTPLETLDQVFEDLNKIIEKLQKEDKDFKASVKRIPSNMATMDHKPMEISLDHPLVKKLEDATEVVRKKKADIISFPGWTDASLISNFANIATVVFGPGDISCAHSEIEYIDIEEAYQGYLIYSLIAIDFCETN